MEGGTSAGAVVAATATLLAAVQLVPQVSRLRRISITPGVSRSWIMLGVVTNLAWTVYRTAQGLWFGVPSPVIAAVLYGVILGLVRREPRDIRLARTVSAVAALLLLGTLWVGGWMLLGVLLGLSGVVQTAPSLWTALRTPQPVGISPWMWTIGVAQAAMWGVYGLLQADDALLLYGCTTALMSSLILLRYGYARRTAAAAEPSRQLSVTIAA